MPTATTHGHPAIKCVGLTKMFRDFWYRNRVRAVDNINLEIHRGEVFGLLGPNGSGKSTTIKMILGLLHPTEGRIAVFGEHPRHVRVKQDIGFLPEESYLYPFLNARETLEYYGRLFHQHRRQRQRRIDMLLDMVGLDAVARRPVGEYSKGMQRRIGLAQALINDPKLLILDEPTTGMDPIGTADVKRLIITLAERGKTILLSSHLLSDVEDVCDRVSIMYGGKIRKEGTVESLLQQQDMTTLETDVLDDKVIEEIESVLQRHGHHIARIARPRQKLETLFLEIVEQARREGQATSGAGSGRDVAAFLRTGEDDGARPAEELLAALTQPGGAKASPASAAPVELKQTPQEPQLPDSLLQSAPVRETPRQAAAAPPQVRDEADEPDDDLLRGLSGSDRNPKDQ